MIFKKVEKVVWLQQPAGRDYVHSIEYSSKILNQVSKVWEILTRRNSTENFRFWNRSSFAEWSIPYGFPVLLTVDLVTFNPTLSIAYSPYPLAAGVPKMTK